MNNKGQTLVLFILLLPIILLLLCLTIDLGRLLIEKRKIENVIKDAIKYELNINENDTEISKNRLTNTIIKNIKNVKIKNIDISSNQVITISIYKQSEGIFTNLFKNDLFDINLTYKGYMDNSNIVIKKE